MHWGGSNESTPPSGRILQLGYIKYISNIKNVLPPTDIYGVDVGLLLVTSLRSLRREYPFN